MKLIKKYTHHIAVYDPFFIETEIEFYDGTKKIVYGEEKALHVRIMAKIQWAMLMAGRWDGRE